MTARFRRGALIPLALTLVVGCRDTADRARLPLPVTAVFERSDAASPPPASDPPSPESSPAAPPTSIPAIARTGGLDSSRPDFVSEAGLEALALVNEWRVGVDLWPLALNEELSALAQSQADYLAGLDEWPAQIHEDALGGLSDDRARRAGWPGYDQSGQAVAVTEIIASGETPAIAVNWWRASEIHTWVVEREYYREAGVGTAEMPFGALFVIVVGSRPNVLPVLLDPARNEVYLTSERYSGGYNGLIGDVNAVQFLPSPTAPLEPGGWLPWNLTYAIPAGDPPGAVALTDGAQVIIMPLSDIAWLPHSLPP